MHSKRRSIVWVLQLLPWIIKPLSQVKWELIMLDWWSQLFQIKMKLSKRPLSRLKFTKITALQFFMMTWSSMTMKEGWMLPNILPLKTRKTLKSFILVSYPSKSWKSKWWNFPIFRTNTTNVSKFGISKMSTKRCSQTLALPLLLKLLPLDLKLTGSNQKEPPPL